MPPCKFKDGDIIFTTLGNIAIISEHIKRELFYTHVLLIGKNLFCNDENPQVFVKRLATEEEKRKLFDVIKSNGYKWNAETKTLEKLIVPKFKVGDTVKSTFNNKKYVIEEVTDTSYTLVEVISKFRYIEPINEDKNWELVPNKFDIATLKPYEEEIMEERKYTDLRLDVDQDDKLATEATIDGNKIIPPENYLIGKITRVDNGMIVEFVKKQPVYPKTYNECCDWV